MEELCRRHIGLIERRIWYYSQDQQEQEDICQEVVLRLLRQEDTLRSLPPQAVGPYIYRTVNSAAVEHFRRKNSVVQHQVPWEEAELVEQMEDPEEDLEARLIRKEEVEQLKKRWNTLPEEARTLLEGKYIKRLNDEELARQLNCRPASIRMKLTRARRLALGHLKEEVIP